MLLGGYLVSGFLQERELVAPGPLLQPSQQREQSFIRASGEESIVPLRIELDRSARIRSCAKLGIDFFQACQVRGRSSLEPQDFQLGNQRVEILDFGCAVRLHKKTA